MDKITNCILNLLKKNIIYGDWRGIIMKIAIIARTRYYKINNNFKKEMFLKNYYIDCLTKLGVLLIPILSENNIENIVDYCDALLITGGPNNVHPSYYGEEPNPNIEYMIDEFPLVKKAVTLFSEAEKPILGICAGIQELNVIFGGTLHQNIPNHYLTEKTNENTEHTVRIEKNSFLYRVYKTDSITVNSYHHQAIKDLAPNFSISAVSSDGYIEGIEKGNLIGVQWHPEIMKDLNLFKKFIDEFINKKI